MTHAHIAVDLDGTAAHYEKWEGIHHIGAPIKRVIDRIKRALELGHKVSIFTARVSHEDDGELAREFIEAWCEEHIGKKLPVTCIKHHSFTEFWDDRAIGISKNTGYARSHIEEESLWAEMGRIPTPKDPRQESFEF